MPQRFGKIWLLLLMGVVLGLASCTEIIDVELDSTYTRLVVYGEITTDSVHHQVSLTKSSDYFSNKPPPPVSDAVVELEFDNQIQAFFHVVTPGNSKSHATSGDVADMNNSTSDFSRGGDGVSTGQADWLAIMVSIIQAQGKVLPTTTANLYGMFFITVGLGVNMLGRMTGRTYNRCLVIIAHKGFHVGHGIIS